MRAGSSGQAPRLRLRLRFSFFGNHRLELRHYVLRNIIQSLTTGRWYYGSTEDVVERLKYHNSGWNRFTNKRGPWQLIFVREFETVAEAREFEVHLKKLRRKEYILTKYQEYFLPP